jgi:hypothetical protein
MNGCDSPAISAEKGNPVRSKAECGEEVIQNPISYSTHYELCTA